MTTEQFLQAQELYNQGKSFTEVGKEVGFSRQAIYNRFVKEGVPIRDKKASAAAKAENALSEATDQREDIWRMLSIGKSIREVAKELKLPIKSVKEVYKTLPELTRRQISYKGSSAEYTDADILLCLQDVAENLGRESLGVTAYSKWRTENQGEGEFPHAMTIIKRFGSWTKAIESAGLEVTKRPTRLGGQSYSDEKIISSVRMAGRLFEHPPSIAEYSSLTFYNEFLTDDDGTRHGVPSANTIIKRYGGWINALVAAFGPNLEELSDE